MEKKKDYKKTRMKRKNRKLLFNELDKGEKGKEISYNALNFLSRYKKKMVSLTLSILMNEHKKFTVRNPHKKWATPTKTKSNKEELQSGECTRRCCRD